MFVPAQTEDAKRILGLYVAERSGVPPEQLAGVLPFNAAAIVRGERIWGAVIYTHYRKTSIEMNWAGDCGWASRGALRAIFDYPFLQLGVLRCYGIVRRSNKQSRQFAVRIGCREAGVLDDEFGPGQDGIIYSMTLAQCRWIN
jgi:RimJ/RimL family protein N-acetyltransferase